RQLGVGNPPGGSSGIVPISYDNSRRMRMLGGAMLDHAEYGPAWQDFLVRRLLDGADIGHRADPSSRDKAAPRCLPPHTRHGHVRVISFRGFLRVAPNSMGFPNVTG